jgi:molecular chaperone HtpG
MTEKKRDDEETPAAEIFPFKTEVRELLDLMVHSLYSHKEIFLRELISNASDALDRLRFEGLTRPELLGEGPALEIRLEADASARTLTIHDNGIGMSRDEVIQNIGTIAKSGTRELSEAIRKDKSRESEGAPASELIGQFGVGFYSAFMVADEVTVVTRRAGGAGEERSATRWASTGRGEFEIGPAEREASGTSVTLHLKPVDEEQGIEDFCDPAVLSRIVRRYSDFIGYPIRLGDETLNSMKPVWERPASEVTPEEYAELYTHISHDWREPLITISQKAEGTVEYRALLFVPEEPPFDLFYVGYEPGLKLYVRRVLIAERSADLLPGYLRFLRGVVDSPDLPLNVSREMLQHDRQIRQIRKGLVKKVLDTLEGLKEKETEKYLTFWKRFGRVLKEGLSEDADNRDKVAELLLFESSNDEEKLTALAEYKARMKDGQEEIYYLTGSSRAVIESSPHLEAFQERAIEVLYLTDAVDELVVEALGEYGGKKLKSVGKGTVDLGTEVEREEKKRELDEKSKSFEGLLGKIQKALDDRIKEVRLSARLTTSPACLVGADHDFSPRLEKLLRREGEVPPRKRILELNPSHAIVSELEALSAAGTDDESFSEYAELLYGYAVLAEGSELPDPAGFANRVAKLMSRGLEARRRD